MEGHSNSKKKVNWVATCPPKIPFPLFIYLSLQYFPKFIVKEKSEHLIKRFLGAKDFLTRLKRFNIWSIPWNGQPLPGISKIYMECYLNTLYWSYNSFLHIKMNLKKIAKG